MGKIEQLIIFVLAFFIRLFGKNKILILNYHRVQDTDDCFFDSDVNHDIFDWQMRLIGQFLTPISLTDAMVKLKENSMLRGCVVVTFDDGYKDNLEAALPILKKWDVPASFFIATGFLNGGIMWNDIVIEAIKNSPLKLIDLSKFGLKSYSIVSKREKILAIEDIIRCIKYKELGEREQVAKAISDICKVQLRGDLMMNDSDVVELFNSGMEIGGHTSKHPILCSESDNTVIKELLDGKTYLETLLKQKIVSFAYPNGKLGKDYEFKHTKFVEQAGFNYAVTTNWGINVQSSDSFQLMRFTPWDKNPIAFMLRLLRLYIFKRV